MRTKRFLAIVAVLFAVFAVSASAAAKDENANTRVVQGVVTNASDAPVNGAVVQLKDTKTLQVRSFITQENGKYHFAGLSDNVDYEVKADHQGASSGSKNVSVFDSRKQVIINLKLNK